LVREFQEETGLDITVGRFLHLHEFRNDNLQALELFFEVKPVDTTAVPQLGTDPEHTVDNQLLAQLAFRTPRQLVTLPLTQVHPILHQIISPDDIYIPHIQFR
jgi:8-oxo-dGTP pyrophosphatase MutT (NUDIX family)